MKGSAEEPFPVLSHRFSSHTNDEIWHQCVYILPSVYFRIAQKSKYLVTKNNFNIKFVRTRTTKRS